MTITATQCRTFAVEVEARLAQVRTDKGPGWLDHEYHLKQAAMHLREAADDLSVVEFADKALMSLPTRQQLLTAAAKHIRSGGSPFDWDPPQFPPPRLRGVTTRTILAVPEQRHALRSYLATCAKSRVVFKLLQEIDKAEDVEP